MTMEELLGFLLTIFSHIFAMQIYYFNGNSFSLSHVNNFLLSPLHPGMPFHLHIEKDTFVLVNLTSNGCSVYPINGFVFGASLPLFLPFPNLGLQNQGTSDRVHNVLSQFKSIFNQFTFIDQPHACIGLVRNMAT